MKLHLSTGHRNVTFCNKVPDHVKIELTEYMAEKKSTSVQLHMVYQLIEASNLDEYGDADILQAYSKGKRKANDNSTQACKRQVGPLDAFYKKRTTPQAIGKQSTINEAYKKEQCKKMWEAIALFVYSAGISFNVVSNMAFPLMCDAIARAGIGKPLPSQHQIGVPLLKKKSGDGG